MRKPFESIEHLLGIANFIIGLDGLKVPENIEVDYDDVNTAIALMDSGLLGKGNHYNRELEMAMYLDEIEKLVESRELKARLMSYMEFLVLDGVTKYILHRVRSNGMMDKGVALLLGEKIRTLNEYVRKEGPVNVFEKCKDDYFEVCDTIIVMFGKIKFGCAS